MIKGEGDIAQVLREIDRPDRLFFASGVSNSRETRESEYEREVRTLLSQDRRQHLVYFGSLSVFYADGRYQQHKKNMERIVKDLPSHTIVRLGNIDWGDNPNTLINSLRAKKARGETLEIQDTYRYIVNKDEFLYWVSLIPDWNCEMNIPGQRMKVSEVVEKYVK